VLVEARVKQKMTKLVRDAQSNLCLTEREIAILACATVQLEDAGYDPWMDMLIVQVVPPTHNSRNSVSSWCERI
jgi:hypothetical protein